MMALAYILSGLSLLMSALFLVRPNVKLLFILFLPMFAAALSPLWAVLGAAGAVLGWIYGAPWAVLMGFLGAGWMTWYIWRVSRDHKGFENAFGAGWKNQIAPEQASHMVRRRWSLFMNMKAVPEPICERDVPFWTIPGTDRQLLCDIWRPADGQVSSLAQDGGPICSQQGLWG